MSISVTIDDIYDALHGYLTNVLELEAEKVVRAFLDNVPTPFPYPFVYMQVKRASRNATNEHKLLPRNNKSKAQWSAIIDVQLDFYGQDSMDMAQTIKGLFRDEFSVFSFETSGLVPLYADEPITSSSEDEKGNFMVRTTLDLHFNVHPSITLNQDFFEEVNLQLKNAGIAANN